MKIGEWYVHEDSHNMVDKIIAIFSDIDSDYDESIVTRVWKKGDTNHDGQLYTYSLDQAEDFRGPYESLQAAIDSMAPTASKSNLMEESLRAITEYYAKPRQIQIVEDKNCPSDTLYLLPGNQLGSSAVSPQHEENYEIWVGDTVYHIDDKSNKSFKVIALDRTRGTVTLSWEDSSKTTFQTTAELRFVEHRYPRETINRPIGAPPEGSIYDISGLTKAKYEEWAGIVLPDYNPAIATVIQQPVDIVRKAYMHNFWETLEWKAQTVPEPEVTKEPYLCECGRDKHGFIAHAGWCPAAFRNEKP